MKIHNAGIVRRDSLPPLPFEDFYQRVVSEVKQGARLCALLSLPASPGEGEELLAVLARDSQQSLELVSTRVANSYPSLTLDCPQAHWFEREIAEQGGLRPLGHPWLKPIRFQEPLAEVGVTSFFQVDGESLHEVAVGPVHAGVIEPGHFRFQCRGEEVLHLEISLGYQHRGVERALRGGPNRRTLHYMETLAGDTTVGHTLAYCQVVESLAGVAPSARAHSLRALALELERLANHCGDLGALAGDIGYLPTASYCGRVRGDFLNLTTTVCGNRLGRGWLIPGGVRFDLNPPLQESLLAGLHRAMSAVSEAVDLLRRSTSVLTRMEGVGRVSRDLAAEIGLVGPAARASGLDLDVRRNFPLGAYLRAPYATVRDDDGGDVYARAQLRWQEMDASSAFLTRLLQELDPAEVDSSPEPLASLAPNCICLSLVEGWRGEICHLAVTDNEGKFLTYKVVDPSFHNWFGLSMAMRNQQISDFPLCNKSFNLSYCGHDL